MIKRFSRLTKAEKREYLIKNLLTPDSLQILIKAEAGDSHFQSILENLSENVVSAYGLPYSVAPNFLIDGKEYIVPMVTEESSVVAAAAKSAGYWSVRNGFKTEIVGTLKHGHIHLKYKGKKESLISKFATWENQLLAGAEPVNRNMKDRGGGIQSVRLVDKTKELEAYYQIEVSFETHDAMGANYMNSCLEAMASTFNKLIQDDAEFAADKPETIMSILSNYSPQNAVKVSVECKVSDLAESSDDTMPGLFAERFCEAVEIARVDISRAVTHNKGFYNGVDAVALATGNDWRAIEANGHAFASADGKYAGISKASVKNTIFHFEATVPLQVGTTGGITKVHPLAALSLKILQNPSAVDLMRIMASAGLASNFAAVKSLVTTGIQKGHMKMHLSNMLMQLNASQDEEKLARTYFSERTVSHAEVVSFIKGLRAK